MSFPSEHDFALFLFQLFVLLSAALGLGGLFRRLGQPAVVGEILAGILLGPSVLGVLAPSLSAALFPPHQTHMLGTLAWLGSVFLLLVAGTEVDLATIRHERRAILSTSAAGIALPFAAGFVLGLNLSDAYLANPAQRTLFAFFLGTALAISAIPLVAKILLDLGLLKSPLGHVIIGSAVLNDMIGWTLFAALLGLVTVGNVAGGSIVAVIGMTLGYLALCLTLGRKVVALLFNYSHRLRLSQESLLGLAVLSGFLCSALAQWIGVHAIFGAFLAGVMIGETGEISNHTRDTLRNFVLYLFAPIFFASMGQRANFAAHFDPWLVSVVTATAVTAKLAGGTLGARLGGMRGAEALAVGSGLMAQGVIQIILAFVALEYALINEKVFVALVAAAIVTSTMSGPLIQWALGRKAPARHTIDLARQRASDG